MIIGGHTVLFPGFFGFNVGISSKIVYFFSIFVVLIQSYLLKRYDRICIHTRFLVEQIVEILYCIVSSA